MKRKRLLLWVCIIVFLATLPNKVSSQTDWKNDFKFQELNKRPNLEVRYTNGDRDAFEIVAADYHLTGDLIPPNLLYDSNTKVPWLWFEITDPQGQLYSTKYAKTKSRINLYRRGPYFCEIHWMDVRFANLKGDTLPARAEVVLYCFPERVKSSIKFYPTGDVTMTNLTTKGVVEKALPIRPLEKGHPQNFNFDLYQEDKPLPDAAFTLKKGLLPVSYDNRKGVYTLGSETVEGFQKQFFDNPNGYEEVAFHVKNDGVARKIYVCHKTLKGEGIVEGGVVLDHKGHPLPILVEVCKNFAGEKEERFYNPRDTAFSETYFPLYLEPNEEVEISSLHLYQNWGRHMTKHWSSLGFFMDYFHSSTGVTETTCYIPFKFGHKTGISIGDFRAMSQETFWGGQPQHDNVAGHNFLTYFDGKKWNYSEYRGTTYKSTGANWCNVEMEYLSSDSSIQLLLDIWEVPQDDELRSFFTARYKVLRPLTVEDAKANFRFLDISTTQQSLRYLNYAYKDLKGQTITKPIDFNLSPFCVKGEEIPTKNSFAAVLGEAKGSNGIMIQSFTSNTGVKPAFSIQQKAAIDEPRDTTVNEHKAYTPAMKKGDIRFSLVPSADQLVLNPGDEISLSGFWLPYGEVNGANTPDREIVSFGADQPQVIAIKKGLALNNLPTTIQVEGNEAQFTIKGGLNVIPIVAKGFQSYQNPSIYEKIEDRWELIHMEHNASFDGMQLFCDVDGKFGAVFLVRTNGEAREFKIKSNEPVVVTKRIDIKPKVSAKAEVLVNNPFEKLSMSLKTDNQVFLKPIQWIENEGKSFAFHGVSGDTLSGARVTGFENQVAIQYWWQNMKETNAFRMPKFELMVGTNLFGGKYKAFIFKDKQLIECKNLKKESTFETTEVTYGVKPGIVILYNPELNYCMGISFKNTDHVFIKKGSIGVTMSKQYCPSGRRKVMEGNVYLIKGNPSGLLQIIEHEMPVWKNALNN